MVLLTKSQLFVRLNYIDWNANYHQNNIHTQMYWIDKRKWNYMQIGTNSNNYYINSIFVQTILWEKWNRVDCVMWIWMDRTVQLLLSNQWKSISLSWVQDIDNDVVYSVLLWNYDNFQRTCWEISYLCIHLYFSKLD